MDRSKVTTISILRNALLSEIKPSIDNSNIKSLCKMLIRVATIHASEEQVMPPVHKAKLPPLPFPSHSDEECASSGDDDDSNKNRPYMSEESEPYHTADEGYEADNEVGVVDILSNTHSVGSERVFVSANTSHHLEHSIQSLENVSKSGTVCPPSGNLLNCREYKKNNLVVHPELCVMVVDLLLDLINRIIDAEDSSKETGNSCPTLTLCNIICSCTNRLATIFFQESNCSAGAGLITRILSNSASRLLKSNFIHFRELQRSVLNLIYVLATRSIDPSELKLYMELFTSSDPPLNALLDPLCRLVDNVHPNVPDFVVCFPVEKYPLADNVPTFNKSSDELSCHIEPLVKSLQYYHTKADIQSCWSKMGVWCGIEGVGWGIWLNGFSVALWLRVQEFQSPVCKTLDMTQLSSSDGSSSEGSERKITPATVSKTVENTENQNPTNREADNNQDGPSNYLHMLSVGHDSLILEFWINTRNGDITIKLTRPDNESNKIVGETTVEGCLPLHQWNHFAMNCKEIMQKRKIYIEVTLFVNGSNTGTALVPVNGILLRKARPACLMIGHSSLSDSENSSPNGSWYLSGLTLFRVPVFNEYNVMYLMSHGPNITPLTSCQSGNHLPDFTIFNDDILYSDIDWDQVFEMSSVNIREMQDNLLLNYSASNPLSVELYHQTIPNPLFGGRIGGGVKGGGFGLPVSLVATWTGLFLSSQHKGLPPAVFILGGPQIFLYLFARVVELNGTSEDQARSLGILLKVICSDTRLYSMFYQDEVLSMLQTVFSTSKCQMSNHYLKVLIDASCSNSINQSNVNIGDLLHLQTQSDAVILHPYILVTIIRSWRELERATKINKENAVPKNKKKANQPPTGQVFSERSDAPSDDDGGLLGTVFLAMGLMLREDNMFRKFNVYQMNRVNMVEHLLLLCKERFLNSDFARLGDTVSVRLVEVIKLLMGFPPLLHHMALLSDFLILMHQASTTFITHARSSFYFLLSPALLPSNPSSNILGLPIPASQKKTKRSSRRKRNNSSASVSDNLDMNTARNISTKKNDSVMGESELNESIKSACIEDSYDIISNESINNIENTPSNSNAIIKESISVNVSKQSKAIINMITKQKSTRKERRKRNNLRNSGNSSSGLSTLDGGANDEPGTSGLGLLQDETRNADSPLSRNLTNEYIVIDNEEIDRQEVQNDSIALYQELRSPVLLQNLRGGSTNSSTVCEGLLLLLEDTIAIMPDTYLDQVLGVVIHSEMFLILGNHREASVRTAVVKVVCALSQRCPPEYMKNLEQGYFFYHLANQISLFPASYELVSACATLVTEHRSRLEFQLEDNAWANVTDKEILKSPPLLAILPCTLHDISLTHNAILLLKKIVDRGSVKVLNEVGICEVILKCLQAIGSISDASFDGRDLILEDLRCLLNKIAIKTIFSQNSLLVQVRMDLHFQLRYIELMERSRFHISSPDCHVAKVVRDTQCSLFESELDFIEEKLKVVTVKSIGKTAKYFTTVLSGTSGGSDREQSDPWSEVFGTTVKLPIAQQSNHKLSRSDLTSRHGALLTQVTAFLMSRDFELQPSSTEINLIERIFSILIIILSDNHRLRSKWWNSLSGTDRRGALCEMFHWMISPGCGTDVLKRIAIKYIFDSTVSVQKIISPSDPSNQRKLAVYLTSALDVFTSEGSEDKTLKAFVLRWISELQPGLALSRDTVVEEACHLVAKDVEQRQCVQTQSYSSIQKSVFSRETLSNKLTESAMSITRRVVDTQNSERKSFLEHLRKQQSVCIASAQKWHRLIELIAHEQGIWHIKDSYPNSWEIDPTEGPSRVRVRLRRCHLDIEKEFVKNDFQQRTDSALLASPLAYLFDWPQNSLQSRLLERLHLNESVSHMTRAVYVTVMSEQHGELLLSDRCIHFLPEPANASSNNSVTGVYWPLDSIVSVSTRRWELRERAVEVFLSSGHAHLLAFDTTTDMEAFLRALDNCHLPNRFDIDSLPESVNLWRNGSMTNWEYLMHLNGWAGRTYNDLMQYPVYPFILADYTSVKLDLNKSTSFRDLRKPMAVQNQKNETHYIKNYNDLKQARKDGSSMIPGINGEPFHYGSHYSNSGTVLHFLVRLPPFTKLFLSYQDNNFDMPDRTFHSLQTTWRLTSCESTTDVKELIPEFFYLPHFLRNSESLNLGVRQCGISVDDVELATWSVNARLFTLIHRQALESSYVRENLPHWIDLVFGYKQTGQAAVDAVNVFHAATYYGFDSSVIKDDLERNAWETMVRLYGQTPRQLLKHPHPHAITDLQHIPEIPLQVLDNVTGLRWGRYCGSPEEMEPKVIWQRQQAPSAFKLIPFLTNEVIGVPSHTTVMLTYVKNKVLGNTMIGTVGLITWGHSDGIIRIKQKKDFPPEPLIQIHNIDRLCVVSHGTGDTMGGLWLGLESGRILVLPPAPVNSSPPTLNFSRRPVYLIGHDRAIVAICVSTAFGVAATASEDGTVIIWDIDRFTYVRTIPNDCNTISHVCISNTLCDVATVHQITVNTSNTSSKNTDVGRSTPKEIPADIEKGTLESMKQKSNTSKATSKSQRSRLSVLKSKIRIHTINSVFVGEVKIAEKVTCICYSNAAEGVSVNAVAVGVHTGSIRLFSSWDLKPIIVLTPTNYTHPLVSICYSHDAHHLYAAGSDGTVMIWEGDNVPGKTPNFRVLSSLSIF